MAKLLPRLEAGQSLATAISEIYGDAFSGGRFFDRLPPLIEVSALRSLRNPVVSRTLSELRKVVNAIVRECGKPTRIVIELARDLKRSKTERQRIYNDNLARRATREQARKAVAGFTGQDLLQVSQRDIDKYLLWEECNKTCPYTQRSISPAALFGPEPQFEIEHIIPRGRSLDDSLVNKTLCATAISSNQAGWVYNGRRQEAKTETLGSFDKLDQELRAWLGKAKLAA
jgi:CRISPR-associated endonuclease Csn1